MTTTKIYHDTSMVYNIARYYSSKNPVEQFNTNKYNEVVEAIKNVQEVTGHDLQVEFNNKNYKLETMNTWDTISNFDKHLIKLFKKHDILKDNRIKQLEAIEQLERYNTIINKTNIPLTRIDYGNYIILYTENIQVTDTYYRLFYIKNTQYKFDSFKHTKFTLDYAKTKLGEVNSRIDYFKQKNIVNKVEAKEQAIDKLAKVKVGDIYHSTYGYNCTKNLYYIITQIKGKFVYYRSLPKQMTNDKSNSHGGWTVEPQTGLIRDILVNNDVTTNPKALYNAYDSFKVGINYAYIWNGRPNHENDD